MNRKELLWHCIQGMISLEDRFDRVETRDVPWISERLGWHKLLPLAAALNDFRKPKEDALQDLFKKVAMQSVFRENEYHRQVAVLFPVLDQAGIDFLPFKGPFWNRGIYPEYSWRHIGDIDLLLTKEGARAASSLLQKMGFFPDLVKGSEEEDFRIRGELTLFPGPSCPHRFPVQLHWAPLPGHRYVFLGFIRPEDFTGNTSPEQWRGIRFRVPCPEVQLLYHLQHAACQHQFKRFALLMTVAHFIRKRPGMDWEHLYGLAEERRALTPLHYGLRFLHAFAPLPAPAMAVMRRIRPSLRARLGAALIEPRSTLFFTEQRGKLRRQIFYLAMSW
jgi:hypothetical protein